MDADTQAWMTRALNAEHATSRVTRNLLALCERVLGRTADARLCDDARACIDNPSGALLDGERTPAVDLLAERDRLAAQIAEAEAGAATMRDGCKRLLDSLEEYVRQSMYLNPEWRDGIVAVQAALATGAGKRLLGVVRGLPEWVSGRVDLRNDPLERIIHAKISIALREHLRAAGIETGGATDAS